MQKYNEEDTLQFEEKVMYIRVMSSEKTGRGVREKEKEREECSGRKHTRQVTITNNNKKIKSLEEEEDSDFQKVTRSHQVNRLTSESVNN